MKALRFIVTCSIVFTLFGASIVHAEKATSTEAPSLFGYRLGMTEKDTNVIRPLEYKGEYKGSTIAVIRKVSIDNIEYSMKFEFVDHVLNAVFAYFNPKDFSIVHHTLVTKYGIGREGTSLQSGDRIEKGEFMWSLEDRSRIILSCGLSYGAIFYQRQK